jgi:predicted metallopeptidase
MQRSLFPELDEPEEPEAPAAPTQEPFDFTRAMRPLMADMAEVCEELRHIDMSRVAVVFSQARHGRLDGMRAAVYPLRFAGGARRARLRGRLFEMPRVTVEGHEALYVVSYTLPRFLNLSLDEKLTSIVHEMYHISPRFDGDLRRFAGGKPYHTGSKRRYDAAMARIARRYVAQTRRPELHAFLRHTFRELLEAHGAVVGVRLRAPNPRRIA